MRVTEVDTSYMVRCPQERSDPVQRWSPGSLGPYGPAPPEPTRIVVDKVEELSTGEALAWLGGFLLVGLSLLIGVLWLVVRFIRRHAKGWTTKAQQALHDWQAVAARAVAAQVAGTTQPIDDRPARVRRQIQSIRDVDPDFSLVLLEDFLYALYAEAQTARGRGAHAVLLPYFREAARAKLLALGQHEVHGVVVGALCFVSFAGSPRLGIGVEIEANYAEEHDDGTHGFYTRERWSLSRRRDARSRPPESIRILGCPSCGAPLDRLLGGTCQYCNRVVDNGNHDWIVESIAIVERGERGPMLIGAVEEEGTDLPTRFDPDLPRQLADLRDKDPDFEVDNLRERVRRIFHVMQDAWSTLRWDKARPFLSDNLFEAQSYWIDAYKKQGLRNVTQDAAVSDIEIVRVTRDRWYCALTARVHASSLDFTVRSADGQVVSGDQAHPRRYTEYWTLIRSSGRAGKSRTDTACPACGASLEVAMTAVCSFCHAKVNSGEFDWVLSRIEQDEIYAG
jgi:hypothetical protein